MQHLGQRLAAKHGPPSHQRVHHRAQTVQIGPRVHRPPVGLLGGHVFRRPQHVAGAREPAVAEEPGDAEIGELDAAVGRQQQIARLDVAVDDAAIVGVAQRPAGIDADLGHLAPIEPPSPPQFLLQAAADDQFHGVEQLAVLFAEAEQPHDVGVVELAEGLDFGLEADAEVLLLGKAAGQQFDGRRFAGLAMDPMIDGPHAAPAKRADDPIGAKPFDFHEGLAATRYTDSPGWPCRC